MKELNAKAHIGCTAARMIANTELGGPALDRFLKLDQNKLPLCTLPLETDGSTTILAILPSDEDGDCSSLALMNAANIELKPQLKKMVMSKTSRVTKDTAAAQHLNGILIAWGLEKHPKTSSSYVPGWEHTVRLYTLPTSVIGSGQTTVHGSNLDAVKAIRKMVAMK